MKVNLNDLGRRQFMADAASKFLGVGLLPMSASSLLGASNQSRFTPNRPKAAKNVIFLNMTGGMTHLDTFDPKEAKDVMGKTEPIATNVDGIRLGHYFEKLAGHADKLAIINSMHTTQGAHAQGQYVLQRSYAPRGTIVHPTLGSWVLRLSGKRNSTIPGYVQIGDRGNKSSSGFFGPTYSAVPIGDPDQGIADINLPSGVSEQEFQERLDLAASVNKTFSDTYDLDAVKEYENLYDDAVRLMRAEDLKAFDITQEPESVRKEYGESKFGRACLLARRLIEHDVRFVSVKKGGWDMHYDCFGNLEEKVPDLDQSFSALLTDLDRRGLLEETVVMLGTEFGRTPVIRTEPSKNNGRDHFPRAYSCVLAGGGIKGGQKYGSTDKKGMYVESNEVTPPMLNATVAYALGLPLDRTIHSPSKRPFEVSDGAKAITALF
ncbi:MAG: DUF1501 domain-containing protein [Verrucomicrobiota bacterium]